MSAELSPSGKYISIDAGLLDRAEALALLDRLEELIANMPVEIQGGKE